VTADELQRRFVSYSTMQVAKFKWPERVEVIDAIPKTGIGKPLKHVLRERLTSPVPNSVGPNSAGTE
jgi:non-ribosomal peptide synthetase component E (peptide arylation enzyme)